MVIEWDVPITTDDGLVLRADVFRPDGPGQHPVILTYGPYAKGLAFQEGYADQWRHMVTGHPDVARAGRATGTRTGRPWTREVGPRRVRLRAGRLPRRGPLPRDFPRPVLPARGPRPLRVRRVGRCPAVEHRQGRHQRHLLLRDERLARGNLQPPHLAAICVWRAPRTSTGTPPTTAASCPRSSATGTTSRSPWSSTGPAARAARSPGSRWPARKAAPRPNWRPRGCRSVSRSPRTRWTASSTATGPRAGTGSPCRC